MKTSLCVVLVAVVVVPALYASQIQNSSQTYAQGTVVEVQKHEVYSPEYSAGGSNPSDASLASRYYAYEVSIRVDCRTYVGRYETPFNYLPAAFTPNQAIQVRVTRHVMYFDLPADPELRMGIVHHSSECGQNR